MLPATPSLPLTQVEAVLLIQVPLAATVPVTVMAMAMAMAMATAMVTVVAPTTFQTGGLRATTATTGT